MNATQAIILKGEERREADRLYTVYSKDYGKFEVMAKGVRKIGAKLKGGLERLTHVRFVWVAGRYYPIVTDVEIIDDFSGIKNDSMKIESALGCIHVLDRAVKGNAKDENVWNVVIGFLTFLDETRETPPVLVDVFSLRLLASLGFRPRLTGCTNCERAMGTSGLSFFFSPASGGVICNVCGGRAQQSELTPALMSLFPRLLESDWDTVVPYASSADQEELRSITNAFTSYVLE